MSVRFESTAKLNLLAFPRGCRASRIFYSEQFDSHQLFIEAVVLPRRERRRVSPPIEIELEGRKEEYVPSPVEQLRMSYRSPVIGYKSSSSRGNDFSRLDLNRERLCRNFFNRNSRQGPRVNRRQCLATGCCEKDESSRREEKGEEPSRRLFFSAFPVFLRSTEFSKG